MLKGKTWIFLGKENNYLVGKCGKMGESEILIWVFLGVLLCFDFWSCKKVQLTDKFEGSLELHAGESQLFFFFFFFRFLTKKIGEN